MKRVYTVTILTCLAILAAFLCLFRLMNISGRREHLTVGFIYAYTRFRVPSPTEEGNPIIEELIEENEDVYD